MQRYYHTFERRRKETWIAVRSHPQMGDATAAAKNII